MADSQRFEKQIRALPIWQGDINIERLSGGLSNDSFVVTDKTRRSVVRFGADLPMHHVERSHEAMASAAAAAAGFAPPLRHVESDLMVFDFIDGKTLQPADIVENQHRLAKLLRRFHDTLPRHVQGAARLFWVPHVIRDYVRDLIGNASPFATELPRLSAAAESLSALLVPMPIVFGHHDLLPANFIDDGEKIWLIDYEYAAFSTALFDLAGLASNAGFTAEQDQALLADYFDEAPSPELARAHGAMKCLSLLREAMWGMVSERHLNLPGIDYMAYGEEVLRAFDTELENFQNRYGKLP